MFKMAEKNKQSINLRKKITEFPLNAENIRKLCKKGYKIKDLKKLYK